MYKQSAPETIQAMFASIAHNYDKTNTAVTFGLHKKWNKKLIHALGPSRCLLDVCAGTGEIAFGFLKKNLQSQAILLDFCPEMLTIAQKKGAPFGGRYDIIQADAQSIPLASGSVDSVSISYGIRNVMDPLKCFHEVYRVLSKGGKFCILELTRPHSTFLRAGHQIYTRFFLPLVGKMTTKNKEAYRYLVNSVETFAAPEILASQLYEAGFQNIQSLPLLGGIATLMTAVKT